MDYVLYEMSYVNMVMYGAVLPSYESRKDREEKKKEDEVRADDPANREQVRKILDSFD